MPNMSYCRFQNTEGDLRDCLEGLEDVDGDLDGLSPEEKRAAKRLIKLCQRIAESYGDDIED